MKDSVISTSMCVFTTMKDHTNAWDMRLQQKFSLKREVYNSFEIAHPIDEKNNPDFEIIEYNIFEIAGKLVDKNCF